MNEKRAKGLPDLHETLVDASEVLAAFIHISRSGIEPLESLMVAAEQALKDVAAWRRTINQAGVGDAGFDGRATGAALAGAVLTTLMESKSDGDSRTETIESYSTGAFCP